ncbi:hypothetical protein [Tellurirhabdus bombi]|uniref:hypothetical protein n=1 Tax=Tellurirhabdus bombi TaxID=2907205 RepID=UPI001F241951|nr:hypothetical protein [Tellurirhabdus bombi]
MKKLVLVTLFVWIIALLVMPAKAQQKPVAKPATAKAKPQSSAVASSKLTTKSTAAKPTVTRPATAAKPAPATKPVAESTPAETTSPAAETKPVADKTSTPVGKTAYAKQSSPRASSSRNAYLNAGLGLGSYVYAGIPIGASFEVDIQDNISVGGSFDFASSGYDYGRYTFMYFGARGSYHLGELLNVDSKFDPYVGLSLGFRTARYKDTHGRGYDYVNSYGNGLFFAGYIGSRYLFSEKLGAFAEVGYGVAALRLGITAKF